MFEHFDPQARQAVIEARAQAVRLRQAPVGTHHLLLALLTGGGPVARSLEARGFTVAGVEVGVAELLGTSETDDDRTPLKRLGIDLDQVRESIESSFGAGALERARWRRYAPRRRFWPSGLRRRHRPLVDPERSPFGPRTQKVLELAFREALRLGSRSVRPEHLGLGLLRDGEGLACAIMARHGIAVDDLRRTWEGSPGASAA